MHEVYKTYAAPFVWQKLITSGDMNFKDDYAKVQCKSYLRNFLRVILIWSTGGVRFAVTTRAIVHRRQAIYHNFVWNINNVEQTESFAF